VGNLGVKRRVAPWRDWHSVLMESLHCCLVGLKALRREVLDLRPDPTASHFAAVLSFSSKPYPG
jgi:hypothetical protein